MTALTEYPSSTTTPQTVRARNDQVQNNAGGFVFELSPIDALRRFLILGTEGGTFYAGQNQHTLQAVKSLDKALDQYPTLAIDTIVDVSQKGLAPKNDQAIFALAYAAGHDDEIVRKYALAQLGLVCRTGTHLFQFAEFVEKFRGWGRGLRTSVGRWYEYKDAESLAYQVTKYRQRNGWSHRDILRLSHPKAVTSGHAEVFDFAKAKDVKSLKAKNFETDAIKGFIKLQKVSDVDKVIKLIGEYRSITHDMIPTEFKSDPKVWHALLAKRMPMTALVRNLGVMTANGTLTPFGSDSNLIAEQLLDPIAIRNSRIHPLRILVANRIYKSGRGMRGSKTWTPVNNIVDALDEAFYLAFDNVEPAGKNTLIALDVSASMTWDNIMGAPITPRDASAAMALVTVRTEPNVHTMAFTGGWNAGAIEPFTLTKKMSVDDAINTVSRMRAGGTDCSIPMLHAQENGLEVDTFIVYTDNETWAGRIQPFQALKQYRKHSGRDAKLVVVGMTATSFSIADPNDRGMLDVVGFDTSAPSLISAFSRGDF